MSFTDSGFCVKLYLRVIDSHDPGKYQVGYLYSMLETAYID